MATSRLPSPDPPLLRQPKFLALAGCALSFLVSAWLFFNARDLFAIKRTAGLCFVYVAVGCGIGTSLLLLAGGLVSRHRLAEAYPWSR